MHGLPLINHLAYRIPNVVNKALWNLTSGTFDKSSFGRYGVLMMLTPILRDQCIYRAPRVLFSVRTLATTVSQTASTLVVLRNRPIGSAQATFKSLDALRSASTKAADAKKSGKEQPTATISAASEEPDVEEEYWVREQVPNPNRTSLFACRSSTGVRSLC